jgi:uncharacterized protein (DUF1800 family)
MTDRSLHERRARPSRRASAPADPSAPGGLDDPAGPPAFAIPPAPVLEPGFEAGFEPPPEATIAGMPIGARLAAARRRRSTGELDVLPEPAPPGSVAKRRAVLVGIAATVGAVATAAWKGLSGGGTDVVSPPPAPPRRAQQITAKEAGAFEDRDQSLARSIAPAVGEAAPPAPLPETLVYPTASAAAAAAQVTVPTILATDDPVVHLLRRVTFGPTPELVDQVHQQGIDAWLADQLNPGRGDPEGDAAWATFPMASMGPRQVQGAQERFHWDAMFEVGNATLARHIWGTHQVKEVMADLWANHLNVSTPGEGGWDQAPTWHRDVIRAHALGSFTEMLLAAARQPAMLRYLTNDDNRAESVNENYGRELLELHTVGIGSGYTEDDVRNSAYILTGRTVFGEDDGEMDGQFRYDAGIHWVGPVSALGFTHPNDSEEGGLEVGDLYLRHLAHHPSTAQTIARKVAVRFVSDDPPQQLVDRLAAAFTEADTAIAPMLDVLFRSVEFWAAVGQKTRRPLENLVASARGVGVQPGGDTKKAIGDLYWRAGLMGHRPLGWPAPNGYPDVYPAWRSVNGLLVAWNTHRALVQGWFDGFSYTEAHQLVGDRPQATVGEYVDSLCQRFCFQVFQPAHRDALIGFLEVGADTPTSEVDMENMADHLVPLVLDSPYFALR